IARGKVNQLRAQLADWRAGGLTLPSALAGEVQAVSMEFGRAVTQTVPAEADAQARAALVRAYGAATHLLGVYLDQVFEVRHTRQPRLDTAFGSRLGAAVPQGAAAE